MAVVVDPALDIRVEHPRQIIERLIAPSMECPPPDRLPYCLACLRTCGGQKRNTELASAPDGGPRPKLVAEEVERLDRIVPSPVGIPAVDELCLLRMQHQPAGREACLQRVSQCLCLLGTPAVADGIVRVPFERDAGKVPRHPHVEGVVQEQIREARTDNPTLRSSCRTRINAAILHLYWSLQPALDVENHPRAIRMLMDRLGRC